MFIHKSYSMLLFFPPQDIYKNPNLTVFKFHNLGPRSLVYFSFHMQASQVVLAVKNLSAKAGNIRDRVLMILGSGRSPRIGYYTFRFLSD